MDRDAVLWRVLDWLAQTTWRQSLAISFVCALVILPGLWAMPVTDRDEARFVQASKQMMETGDLIDIRFQDQPRWKKPVGIYWLQAASATLLSDGPKSDIWAYRLPSVLAAWIAALATAWAARALITPRGALLAGMMMATSLLLAAEANIAKTDAALTASGAVALGALAHIVFGRGGIGTAITFWAAIAVSILIKGPIVPVIAFFAIAGIALKSEWRSRLIAIRPFVGLGLVLVLVAPWLIAIWQVSDGAFFQESLGRDMGAKIASGQEKHWGPPGLYIALVWLTFWPWAALLPLAAGWVWRERRAAWVWMLLAWSIPFWLILELVPTKLPHYVLPLYPAIAILLAAWLTTQHERLPRWGLRTAALLTMFPPVLASLALAAGVVVISWQTELLSYPLMETSAPWAGLMLALIAVGFSLAAARAILAERLLSFSARAAVAAVLVFAALLQFSLPRLGFVFPSPAIAQTINSYRMCASGPAFSVGYHEPSLVFRTETAIRLADPTGALNALASDPGAMFLLTDRWREILQDIPPSIARAEFTYFNYNRGKTEHALLLTQDHPRWDECQAGEGR